MEQSEARSGSAAAGRSEEFLADWESGLEKAGEYKDYIRECMDWAARNRRRLPEGVRDAVGNLRKIFDRLGRGVDLLARGTEMIQLSQKLYALADATASLDLEDEASVRAWLVALEDANQAASSVRTVVEMLGKGGSVVFSRFSLFASVLSAYITIGVEAIARVQAASAYRERRVRRAGREPRPEPPPPYPGDWRTAGELEEERAARERFRQESARSLMREAERRVWHLEDTRTVMCPEVPGGCVAQIRREVFPWLRGQIPVASPLDAEMVWQAIASDLEQEELIPLRRYQLHISVDLPRHGALLGTRVVVGPPY